MIKHLLVTLSLTFALQAHATIVELQTSEGTIQINLFDNATPATVENFLAYVNSGRYDNTIFHRSVSDFIVQGGGFAISDDPDFLLAQIDTDPAILNEPVYSNVRGTIAMAKNASSENSATSQFFFNLVDNAEVLDGQNGGFTVFGQVIGNGMTVVDNIAALNTYNFGSPFNELPVVNYTDQDYSADDPNARVPLIDDNLVKVFTATIIDSTVDTAANLNPPRNTQITPPSNDDDDDGGSISFAMLLMLLLARRLK
ncbi:MAG: peptidylprolyl isomerase [Kangiellaceae bacterium]|jgi:cyclophilin family peptidyl-prolyl cis-trans isomerase|nr:peptidylprolyl isomerase [Kangiellaceae bacterium]